MEFRNLKADEIEIRQGIVKATGVMLLLYKDARVDQKILDETVGPENWMRDHKELKGNIYCGIGIWDENKRNFVMKWDAGKETYTEAEKGFCFASNSYLAKLFNINEVTVSRKLGILENKKYITIEYERCGARVTGRKIRLTKMLTDDYQKCKSAVNKNVKDNNTSINNTSINNIYSMNKKTNNKCFQTAPKNAKFENSREYTQEEYDSFCDV